MLKWFGRGRAGGQAATSVLTRQIAATLRPGMVIPRPLEQLFAWIEARGCFIDTPNGRLGFLYPEEAMKRGRTEHGRPGGTDIDFFGEGNVNLKYWFGKEDPDILERLCVFAKTGREGSMAAFWLADDGAQKIVHMGSGSGSVTVCVMADDAIDFLRILAIGYDEICWGDEWAEPPNASGEFVVEPNREFQDWVTQTFGVTIPRMAIEIAPHPVSMDADDSPDPFWRWVRSHSHN